MRSSKAVVKALHQNKKVTHRECLQVVRDMIGALHGVDLTIEQVGKRWRDIKEGMEPEPIEDNQDALDKLAEYIKNEKNRIDCEEEEVVDEDDCDDDDEGEWWKKGKKF